MVCISGLTPTVDHPFHVVRHDSSREQVEIAAQDDKLSTGSADRRSIIATKVGDRLEIRHATSRFSHNQLDVALAPPSDRRARGHQHRQRSGATDLDGAKGAGCDRMRATHGAGRPRLLQRRRGTGLRGHRHCALHSKTQTSANAKCGLFTVADFIYDAREGPLHMSAGKHLTKGKVRSTTRQYRSLSQPHRLLDLRTQAQLHARQAQAPEALGA